MHLSPILCSVNMKNFKDQHMTPESIIVETSGLHLQHTHTHTHSNTLWKPVKAWDLANGCAEQPRGTDRAVNRSESATQCYWCSVIGTEKAPYYRHSGIDQSGIYICAYCLKGFMYCIQPMKNCMQYAMITNIMWHYFITMLHV